MYGCNCTQNNEKRVSDPHIFLYVSPYIKLFDVQEIFKRKFSGGFFRNESRLLNFITSLNSENNEVDTEK